MLKYIFFTLIILFSVLPSHTAKAAPLLPIDDMRATAPYWEQKYSNGDEPMMSTDEVAALNASMQSRNDTLADLSTYPISLSRAEIQQKISAVRDLGEFDDSIPEVYQSLRPLMAADYLRTIANASPDLATRNPVAYGVVVRRTNLRLLPESRGWFANPTDTHYDTLQATAIDPAEPVLILTESRDNKFVFLQMRNYTGWANAKDIARTDREHFLRYWKPDAFLVVTSPKKHLPVKGENLLFQMGAILPLAEKDLNASAQKGGYEREIPSLNSTRNLLLEGRSTRHPKSRQDLDERIEKRPATPKESQIAYTIRLPYSENGKLREKILTVTGDDTLHEGFLPVTRNQFIRQALKFRGEVYGWGGLDDSVDCSSFAANVYRSMGIELPRDADEQENAMPLSFQFGNMDLMERKEYLKNMRPGTLLFTPSHVALYLGTDGEGEPIVAQSVSSSYSFEGGRAVKRYPRRVLVSNLIYDNADGNPWLSDVTSIGGL